MRISTAFAVHQLTFAPNFFPVNCYLVEEDDGLTLVDAAMPFCETAILRAAEALGKPLVRLVVTHAHLDHIGALDGLKKRLPGAEVWLSPRDARLLLGDRGLDANEPQTPIRGTFLGGIRTRPNRDLQDGSRVGSLLAVATPGHTPGSMSLLDTRSGVLIAGDAFQTRGDVAVSGTVVKAFPFPARATWNRGEALTSARKLRALNPTWLGVGHGDFLPSPTAFMDKAIATAQALDA